MSIADPEFLPFLLRAKRATYAATSSDADTTGGLIEASRLASHDLSFEEGRYRYLDSYLGGFSFIGEEAVWLDGKPMWGMNYYGTFVDNRSLNGGGTAGASATSALFLPVAQGDINIPDGFGDFLKRALREAPPEAPLRGPADFVAPPGTEGAGRFTYRCIWQGTLARFRGQESIAYDGEIIYQLDFHGGLVV